MEFYTQRELRIQTTSGVQNSVSNPNVGILVQVNSNGTPLESGDNGEFYDISIIRKFQTSSAESIVNSTQPLKAIYQRN